MNDRLELLNLLDWDKIFHSLKVFKYEEDASKAIYKIKRNMDLIKAKAEESVNFDVFSILKDFKLIPPKVKLCPISTLLDLSNVAPRDYLRIGFVYDNEFRIDFIKNLNTDELLYCYTEVLDSGGINYKVVKELLKERGAL